MSHTILLLFWLPYVELEACPSMSPLKWDMSQPLKMCIAREIMHKLRQYQNSRYIVLLISRLPDIVQKSFCTPDRVGPRTIYGWPLNPTWNIECMWDQPVQENIFQKHLNLKNFYIIFRILHLTPSPTVMNYRIIWWFLTQEMDVFSGKSARSVIPVFMREVW